MTTDDKVLAFVQSRLPADELQAFEIKMSHDADLRAQVAAMTAVRGVFATGIADQPKDGWARLSEKIDGIAPKTANDNRPIRLSLLQVACVALAAVLVTQLVDRTLLSSNPAGFQPASAGQDIASVQVVFAAQVVHSDITALLQSLGGRIVDGPTALGIYTVAFDDVTKRQAAFDILSARPDIAEEVLNN